MPLKRQPWRCKVQDRYSVWQADASTLAHDVVEQTSVAQAMLGLRAHTYPSGEGSIIFATLTLQLEQFRLQVTFSVRRCQVESAVDNQPSNSSECSHLQRRNRGITVVRHCMEVGEGEKNPLKSMKYAKATQGRAYRLWITSEHRTICSESLLVMLGVFCTA